MCVKILNWATINIMIQYVDVICKMSTDGNVTPLSIFWSDGRKFEIDKILDKRKCASTKGGGKGIRYTCKICGHQKYLFLNDYFWWVELPN